MPKDNDKPKSEQQEPEPESEFSREQYEMLKRCSNKVDITEWNKWREDHPDEKVQLIVAPLEKFWFGGANLQDAILYEANLQGAYLGRAKLQGANLGRANLQGAWLGRAKLQGANFSKAIVDGATLIWACKVNPYCKGKKYTNFEGVGLNSIRIDPGTKQLLEYNIRRKNWEEWYKGESEKEWIVVIRSVVTFPVRLFWAMNDYGRSTLRIISTFFGFAIAFAFVYWLCPSLVVVDDWFIELRGFVHALYFSVVTMTTLGFGDIAANPDNWVGQVLLMVQVILGYVLLGALITRFAVLFTAGGPAGTFSKREPIETGKGKQGEKQKDQQSK